ncbi:DUF6884 domain-containing protein [Streptomyces californicus]|uniref:DUF6884 domain-containing protein n=1 Tax=Streptomyces californicus TaxID=67351 RepID=UPI00364746ED
MGTRPDPAGMEDGEIAAEREALAPTVRRGPYGHEDRTPLGVARRERDELLRGEQARRTAVELEARPPVVQLTDEDLQAEGAQLVKDRHQRPPEAAEAFKERVAAVGAEIADRRLHAWGEQPPAEGLDDVELTEALEALRELRLSDTEFAGSIQAKDRVEEVFKARRHVLEEQVKQRDEEAFKSLLETDGRIRLETYSHSSRTTKVRIDNRYYGEIVDWHPGTRARLWRERDVTHDEVWRTDALRWLIEEYEKDPRTRDTRTWGAYVAVELPPSFVDQLTTHFSDLTLAGEAEKYLIGQVADSSRSQSWDETGKKIMVHALDMPERTLPVLERMGRRLVDRLDEELDSDDKKTRDRAKRARPNVLRALDDLVALMGTRSMEPLGPDNASAESPQDGEADSERVRDDGPSALGDVPAAGAVADGGPGGVLPGSGDGRAGQDRGADRGEDGRSDAGDGPPAAGGQAEGGSADGPGTGAEGDRVPGAGGGQPGRGAAPVAFRPASQEDLAPAGERAKAAANLEAVRVLKRVREEKRPAGADEQQVLARWSGWGSVPEIFAARPLADDPVFGPGGEREGGYAAAAARWESFTDVRDPLRVLLDDDEWRAAAASTLSAHYTPPEITSALWQALADLGFDGGEVLEPGSGSGVTFGTAPESARLTGVEIDPTSAAISRLLAPGVRVLNESFADTVAPDGSFDGVVGNVPFARVSLYDPRHNRGRHRLHNHFLIKSVALTRPGGVVALITSRHTLDAESTAARKELSEMADLLGAVRLPNKAFARSAGTDVVTDILVLRRRMDGEEPLDRSWLTSSKRAVGENQLPVNDYFAAHPEHVLGTLTSRMGAHGPEVAVDGDPDVGEALRTALRQVTDSAVLARRWYAPHPEGPHRPPLRLKPAADLQDFTGRLSADVEGKLWQTSGDGELVAVELPADQHAQLAALIDLKDLVRGLNELDRSGSDLALADAHRRLTRETYERYVATHGALSRPRQQQNVTTQTGQGESVTGLTAWGYFLNDPQAYEVLALEMWEADSETVHVSEILDHAPAARRSVLGQHTDDAQQALDAVVAERGRVDLAHIAWMLQVDEDEARRRLARSVFTDPLTGELLYSADYLSGDVRTKLEIARRAALHDAAFRVNVAELERVQPREMLPGQFAVRLGAAWLPDDLVQEFFRKHLGDAHLTIQHSGNGNWHILKGRGLSEEDEIKHSAGGLAPLALLNRVLNGGSMTGRPHDDEEAARAVRVKAEEWRDAFEAWVLDDSVRAARAADVYNRQMNNRVVRDFTGSRPSLTGLDPDFDPYDHQLAAAARMAHERCLVLSHVVGAGKTGALTLGMMAMKNTGQINKPMVAVPNYLVEQWEGEVHRLFPAARILTLTSADLADGKRDRMFQYVRANSFDLIIMSHSLFDSIPLSPEFYEFYNDEELRKLDAQILHERRREGKSISLKQLQERRQQHEESLKEKAAAVRTPGQVYIDDLGLDFFAIDEAHEYKNLAVRSKIPGARVAGSAKAQHLHAVLEWARRNKPTGPMGCLATGTPLSNAIGELHTLLLLANPDLLRDLGIEEFDAFATMYGKMVERLEMTVDGKGFKSVERFASFHSVNSLLRQLWLPVVDYKDEEDLGLPLPSIKGGEPELMLVPATTEQQALMEELGERYEAYHQGKVDKSEDNPLSINTDARVIALDPRLIDAQAEPGNKLRMLADRIAAKYHETKNNQYTYSTEDLRPHPVTGALQMVFLNQGTPGGKNRGNFNAYQELKDLLIERDVPAEKIDFIHDASRADQRRKLTARANHGGSNVLIGSTQRMGKGLNAQNRVVALYHVDPDFRPADMKQKDGRALRQGNQNKVVEIVWVATENTFDSRMYGILATKAKGFDQLYKARLDAGSDEIQEVDEAIVPFEEAMAIISGNPYLIAQGDLRKKLRTLTLDQNNRATQRAIVFKKIQKLNRDIDTLARDIKQRGRVLPSLRPVLGDDFEITLGGVTYTKHKDAAAPLTRALAGVLEGLPEKGARNPDTVLGRLGGRDLVAVAFHQDGQEAPFVRVHLDRLPGSLHRFDAVELSTLKGETLLRRLTKTITEAPQRQTEDEGNLTAKQATRDELLVYSEQLRGQVPGLGRARERLSLVDGLVAAQIAVNKAGKPTKDESASETEKRKQAIERRDVLQQQLDQFDATPPAEASTEAGEALLDLDELRPRDPGLLTPRQVESEAAILRAHIAVHGDPDGTAAARLAELQTSLVAASLDQRMDGLVNPAPNKGVDGQRPAPAPRAEGKPESAETGAAGPGDALQGLIDGFGDRVMVGHIGGQRPAPEPPGESDGQPTEQPGEQPEEPAETAPAPPADEVLADEEDDAPAPDGDGYGTTDLFEAFGLTQPDQVPVSEAEPEGEPESETPAGVSDGQMTVEEVQSEAAPDGPGDVAARGDGRVRLSSADGRLTFTLLEVPANEGLAPQAVDGYQRRLSEFTAVVETKNEQSAQTAAEQAEQLARWRRTFKGDNRLEPFRPLPSLRLTPRVDTPGLIPAAYDTGSWVTWRDGQSGEQVTGQVMGPGPATATWFVSTDRTGHTGEYHVLSRRGKKSSGYTYSLNGAATDLRPVDGPGQQLPLEDLPTVDAVPYRPVVSYADWLPPDTHWGRALARVREPIEVTVGQMGPRFDRGEVAFDVVADGIPFVVKSDQNDETLTMRFVPRVESEGTVVAEFAPRDSRAEAVDFCVHVAREARELADKPLWAQGRNHAFDLAGEGVCGRCSLHLDDNDVKPLYRVDGGDADCASHLFLRFRAEEDDVASLARARRIWATRTTPEPEATNPVPPAGAEQPDQTPAEAETLPYAGPPTGDPREVARQTLQGGNRITIIVSGHSVEWNGDAWGVPVPETVTVTGTVYPGHRDYHQHTRLLDAVIHDQTDRYVAAPDSVHIRFLPDHVQLIPAGHRDDLRPEPRTVRQIRLGDLIAEGGTRGETVTELRLVDPTHRGNTMQFTTRDAATNGPNTFGLSFDDEVLVVPRERRAPQDVAAVFDRHYRHHEVETETRHTHELHAAVQKAAARAWPDDTSPQEHLQALDTAIAAITVAGPRADAYRAAAATTYTAQIAADALFDSMDDAVLNYYVGKPLNRLRQHLDTQTHRLRATAAHLDARTTEVSANAKPAEGPPKQDAWSEASSNDHALYNRVPGIVAGPGVVKPGMHVEHLPGYGPGPRVRYPHGGIIVSVGPRNVVWRPYKWHQNVRTPLDHMRIDAGAHLNLREAAAHHAALAPGPQWTTWSLAEHLAHARRTTDEHPGPLVIIPCGSAKLDRKATAGELYIGPYHRSCRDAADALTANGGTTLILSALHGFVTLDQEIEPYDLSMGQPGSVSVELLREQAQALGLADAQEVILLGGAKYTEAALKVWPAAHTPLAGLGSMGEHRRYLALLAEGAAEPQPTTDNAAVPAHEPPAESMTTEDERGEQLEAALNEGETIAPVSFTDRREPVAGWILTTAAGHTFRLRPATHAGPDEDQWEAGHDADGGYWWNVNIEDRPLAAMLARIREDTATRTRFAALWAQYGHLTEQTPQFETTTNRVQLEEGVCLVSRFGRVGLVASCRWGWEHLTDPDGAQGHTGEDWSRRGPDNRQYVAEWQIWHLAQEAIPNERLRVVDRLTDDMADTPDAYCDASYPYVGKCSAKRSGARYTVAVDTDQGSEIGHYTVCARCLSHRLLSDADRQIDHHDVKRLARTLAKGDPKVGNLHWKQWDDRAAEIAGQLLSAALDAGEAAPWPAQALAGQILSEACEAGDDRAMREARATVKSGGGKAKAQKQAAEEALAARQDRAALVARRGEISTGTMSDADREDAREAAAILDLAGWEMPEGSGVTPGPAEKAAPEVVVSADSLTVRPWKDHQGEESWYQFDVTGPGLTVGKYKISHDAQGKGARGIMWRAFWHGVEPSGRWDIITIGRGEGTSAALAAVTEHAANANGDMAAGFTFARRMNYHAGEWVLPDVGESEQIQYHPDGSWTITAETGTPYTVRREWRGRDATNDLAPLLIEDQTGAVIASCTAVDGYMTSWAPMLKRLRLHATTAAEGVPHATDVTLGGPTQEWVEAWCVCGWTERADVAAYADRAPAGEALALAHRQEASEAAESPVATEQLKRGDGIAAAPEATAQGAPVAGAPEPEASGTSDAEEEGQLGLFSDDSVPAPREPVPDPAVLERAGAVQQQYVRRATLWPGSLITFTLADEDLPHLSGRLGEPPAGPWEITGHLDVGWHPQLGANTRAVLLDTTIRDAAGQEVATGDVPVQAIPREVRLDPAGQRMDLYPEGAYVTQVRVGDLYAADGIRGAVVTAVLHTDDPRGATTCVTRDVTTGAEGSFTAPHLGRGVSIVPRSRRRPEDVTAVFGEHANHREVLAGCRTVLEGHQAFRDAVALQWPEGGGPRAELRSLDRAMGLIDPLGRGAKAYRSNSDAMAQAVAAAQAVFAQTPHEDRYQGHIGRPLHELTQLLDIESQRLGAVADRLERRSRENGTQTAVPAQAETEQEAPTELDTHEQARPGNVKGDQPDPMPQPRTGAADMEQQKRREPVPSDGQTTATELQAAPSEHPDDGEEENLEALLAEAVDELLADPSPGASPETPAPAPEAMAATSAQQPMPEDLDVVLGNVEMPPLSAAEPYSTDVEAQTDIDQLNRAFARWETLPAVERYYEADQSQRPDGAGSPTNAVAQLKDAYRRAALTLRDGPASSPDEVVRQVHTVAVWSGTLRRVVHEELRGPLEEVQQAAVRLAARSQATIDAFEEELAALATTSVEPTSVDPEEQDVLKENTEQTPSPAAHDRLQEDATQQLETEPADDAEAAAAEASVSDPAESTAETTADAAEEADQEDVVAGEQNPTSESPAVDPQLPAQADDEPGPEIEDPPAPQTYTEVFPLPADAAYELHLTGTDGQGHTEGQLRLGGAMIAAVRPSANGRWFARLTADGLPDDVTALNDSPQDAAAQGAVMFAVLTGTPYGPPPSPAVGEGRQTRVDVLRNELRSTALTHLRTISAAIGRVAPDYDENPRYQTLKARINDLAAAQSESHGSRQMAANLDAVQQAARRWGGFLSAQSELDERLFLAFPLADLLHNTSRLQGRLQATLAAVREEQTSSTPSASRPAPPEASPAQQQAPRDPDTQENAEPTAPTPPAASTDADATSGEAPAEPPTVPQEPEHPGPTASINLRKGAGDRVIARIVTPHGTRATTIRRGPLSRGPLPDLSLPITVEIPMMTRSATMSDQPVSTRETSSWLAAHLETGPMSAAWRISDVSSTLIDLARDVVHDGVAPSAEDIATWLFDRAVKDENLLRAAHNETLAAFKSHFLRAADRLINESGTELLRSSYFRPPPGHRSQAVALAADDLYYQLRYENVPLSEGPKQQDGAVAEVRGEAEEAYTVDGVAEERIPGETGAAEDLGMPGGDWADVYQSSWEPDVPLSEGPEQQDGAVAEVRGEAEEAYTVDGVAEERIPGETGAAENLQLSDVEWRDSDQTADVTPAWGPTSTWDSSTPDEVPDPTSFPEGLPLYAGTDLLASTEEEWFEQVEGVKEAWDEHVPAHGHGTGTELLAELQAGLAKLQEMLSAPDAEEIRQEAATRHTDTATPAPLDETGAEQDPQDRANRVNTALGQADAQAITLQSLPEWQRIQTVRGAFGNLINAMKERAGEYISTFMSDSRVGEFTRRLSLRVCERIATWAQAGAARLRRESDSTLRPEAALPSADALQQLGNAAHDYAGGASSWSPSIKVPAPDVNQVPAMRKMGEALNRPMPGATNLVSTAAARGRSTTVGKRPAKGAKKPPVGGEQAGHLRRSGEQRTAVRRPNHR